MALNILHYLNIADNQMIMFAFPPISNVNAIPPFLLFCLGNILKVYKLVSETFLFLQITKTQIPVVNSNLDAL